MWSCPAEQVISKKACQPFARNAHRSSVEGDYMKYIKYEVDGHKATITLNRPDALNALSPHMITELRTAYDEAENDDNIWILIVTGTGRAFCTGADVGEIPEDGRVIYERPYLSTYDQWEAPQDGQAGAGRDQRIVLWRRAGLDHHGRHRDRLRQGDVLRPTRQHRLGGRP